MCSITKEVVSELLPFVRIYKDGTVERLSGSPHVPPSLDDPKTNVSSKDITISKDSNIFARVYLPKLDHPHQKLPILVYFHGGGFCFESAFSSDHHRYISILTSQAKLLAVSIEYRLAPEHPLPTAYEDCWAALQWVCSHSIKDCVDSEPWLIDHGNFDRLFLGGDSAGGNIAHNIAMRAGIETLNGGVKIEGAYLNHTYFWGSEPIGSEPVTEFERQQQLEYKVWKYVYPSAQGGVDNPMMNPFASDAPSLARLGCSRLLVCVAGKDILRDRGVRYCEAVRESGWKGEVELFEVEEEGHVFYVYDPENENAKAMFKVLASFLLK